MTPLRNVNSHAADLHSLITLKAILNGPSRAWLNHAHANGCHLDIGNLTSWLQRKELDETIETATSQTSSSLASASVVAKKRQKVMARCSLKLSVASATRPHISKLASQLSWVQALHKDVCSALEGVERIHTTSKVDFVRIRKSGTAVCCQLPAKCQANVLSHEGDRVLFVDRKPGQHCSNSALAACSSLSWFVILIRWR